MLQISQKPVESKDFYRTKRISDISTLDLGKTVVSKSIHCINGKDQRYEVGYKDGEKIVSLYIKTLPKVFSYEVPKNQPGQWCFTWKIMKRG